MPVIRAGVRRDRFTVEVSDAVPDPVGQPAGMWAPVFHDHFNSSMAVTDSPNGLVNFGGPTWKAWYPGTASEPNPHTNNPGTELEYYDTSALSVSGGLLNMTARYDNAFAGFNYVSGMVNSNPAFNFTYGFVEARVKCPNEPGAWPAVWLIPADYSWPPEIDMLERFGGGVPFCTTWSTTGDPPSSTDYTGVAGDQFQVYGLKWQAGRLDFYVNGSLAKTETRAGSVPDKAMYVVLNLAINGDNGPQPANYPITYQADYVRVWQPA